MIEVDVKQAQADLPRYLEAVARGETVVVCKNNRPVAEIRPLAVPPGTPRTLGLAKGLVEIPPSLFDPLPDDLLAAFNGEAPDAPRP